MQVKPKEQSIISVEASPNAFIGVMAVDSGIADLNDENKMVELLLGFSESDDQKPQPNSAFGNSNFFMIRSGVAILDCFGENFQKKVQKKILIFGYLQESLMMTFGHQMTTQSHLQQRMILQRK